jgi:hypothetical protein
MRNYARNFCGSAPNLDRRFCVCFLSDFLARFWRELFRLLWRASSKLTAMSPIRVASATESRSPLEKLGGARLIRRGSLGGRRGAATSYGEPSQERAAFCSSGKSETSMRFQRKAKGFALLDHFPARGNRRQPKIERVGRPWSCPPFNFEDAPRMRERSSKCCLDRERARSAARCSPEVSAGKTRSCPRKS